MCCYNVYSLLVVCMRICAVIYTICTITLSANDLINDLNHFERKVFSVAMEKVSTYRLIVSWIYIDFSHLSNWIYCYFVYIAFLVIVFIRLRKI